MNGRLELGPDVASRFPLVAGRETIKTLL